MNELSRTPTEQLVEELVGRGCLKISTKKRELYRVGYRLTAENYVHKDIKADVILVFPPF